jgi:hypothetical protein
MLNNQMVNEVWDDLGSSIKSSVGMGFSGKIPWLLLS